MPGDEGRASLAEVAVVATGAPDLARRLQQGVALGGGGVRASDRAALDELQHASLQVHAGHDVVVRHDDDDVALRGLDIDAEALGRVGGAGRRPHQGGDVEPRGDDLGNASAERVAREHEVVLWVAPPQRRDLQLELGPDLLLRPARGAQMRLPEQPLDHWPGQDGEHRDELLEGLQDLDRGVEVGVGENVEGRGCALDGDDASAALAGSGEVEVRPARQRLVLCGAHELRSALSLEAVVEHVGHAGVGEAALLGPGQRRGLVDNPRQVREVQRPQPRTGSAPGLAAERVGLWQLGQRRVARPPCRQGQARSHVGLALRPHHEGLAAPGLEAGGGAAHQHHAHGHKEDEDEDVGGPIGPGEELPKRQGEDTHHKDQQNAQDQWLPCGGPSAQAVKGDHAGRPKRAHEDHGDPNASLLLQIGGNPGWPPLPGAWIVRVLLPPPLGVLGLGLHRVLELAFVPVELCGVDLV
mmetsp:Transcript_91639/g.285086  ORF Transcript_91639/g.285086 Transcript_91639/m.285086 type:complete len:469 (+) Transcript_91639:176-1582(+)